MSGFSRKSSNYFSLNVLLFLKNAVGVGSEYLSNTDVYFLRSEGPIFFWTSGSIIVSASVWYSYPSLLMKALGVLWATTKCSDLILKSLVGDNASFSIYFSRKLSRCKAFFSISTTFPFWSLLGTKLNRKSVIIHHTFYSWECLLVMMKCFSVDYYN